MDAIDKEMLNAEVFISDEVEINSDDFYRSVERICRTSREYKSFVKFLRNVEDENHCIYVTDIDFSKPGLRLEMHHPIRLYNLAVIELRYLIEQGYSNISTIQVAEAVMRDHYDGIIPYVFLSATYHELVHSDDYAETYKPKQKDIKGDWRAYINKYKCVINQEEKKSICNWLSIQEEDEIWDAPTAQILEDQ